MLEKSKKGAAFGPIVAITIFQSQLCGAYAQDETRWFSELWSTTATSTSKYAFGMAPSEAQPKHQEDWQTDLEKWATFSANLEISHRSTNFYKSEHNTALYQGDSRIEFWMPPGRKEFSWGPYIRLAGLTSSKTEAWENAWLAGPGFGVHVFPFSYRGLREKEKNLGRLFDPLRVFAEYNRLDYWGPENEWRPDEQVRFGLDYWRQTDVNDLTKPLWSETWSGLFWQSANEFDKNYDTTILGNALRMGIRRPNAGVLSMFTPYALVESSLTDNKEYYWENKLIAGVGIRFAPELEFFPREWRINRFVVFVEYMNVVDYYHDPAPSSVPDHDFRAGIGLSIGEWYRDSNW